MVYSALKVVEVDENLNKTRKKLVPKLVAEE
jgi:hypothetical protein